MSSSSADQLPSGGPPGAVAPTEPDPAVADPLTDLGASLGLAAPAELAPPAAGPVADPALEEPPAPPPVRTAVPRLAPVTRLLVALAVAYVALRLLAVLPAHDPVLYYDSGEFRAVPGGPAGPFVNLLGHALRPWPVPLLYSLFATAQPLVWLQVALSTTSWLTLAAVLAAPLRDHRLRVGVFALVLLYSCTAAVTNWDRTLLAESAATSVAALCLAAWTRFVRRPTWPLAAAAVLTTILLQFTRTQVVPLTGALALAVAGWALVPQPRGRRLVEATTAVGLAGAMLWGVAATGNMERTAAARPEGVGPFGQNFVMNLQQRILPDPEALAWFRQQGMPATTGIQPPARDDGGFERTLAAYAANPELRRWVEHEGAEALVRYSLTHPTDWPLRFGRQLPDLFVPIREDVVYADVATVLPAPVEDLLAPTSVERERRPTGFPAALLLVALAGAAYWTRGCRRNRLLLVVAAGTWVYCWAALYLAWLVSPMEVVRHSVPFVGLLLLSTAVALAATLDAEPPSVQPGGCVIRFGAGS